MKNTHHLLFEDLALNQKQKMIWSLDSPYQNHWKTVFFSNLYAIIHQKIVSK